MKLSNLPKINKKRKKIIGRGLGSGKGKTGGKGTKGQNVRGKIPITHSHYEGGQRPIFKRLPYKRGKGNSKISKKPICINLKVLNLLPKGSIVDLESLIKFGIVDKEDALRFGVKVLGDGQLNFPLEIKLPMSKRALQKVAKIKDKPNS